MTHEQICRQVKNRIIQICEDIANKGDGTFYEDIYDLIYNHVEDEIVDDLMEI